MSSDQERPIRPSGPSPLTKRPAWALPVLVVGVVCSLAVGWLTFDYARGQATGEAPTKAMIYMIWLLPMIAVGLTALAAGAFATSRPWSDRPWWLPWALVAASVAWYFVMLAGPGLLVSR
jgi:hypothetical protein